MTYLTGEVTVIHTEGQVNFSAFTYSAVHCNTNSALPGFSINGADVMMVVGDTLEVIVHEEGTVLSAGYVLLGNPVPPQTQYKTGKITGNTITETYQFVNIQNGNPTTSTVKL